ncbi:signal peptidase 22kDa subunit [Phlyctochytrium arcticum]|nr:signal peptidase 22kDa subunit [Phlyctochytrium arcticum]
MHTPGQRLNTIFAFFVTVLFSVLTAAALSGAFQIWRIPSDAVKVNIKLVDADIKMGRIGYYYDYSQPPIELGSLKFDLDADLTKLWNWNTKQLFLFLVLDYQTPDHNLNHIVVWDDIITSKADALINLRKQESEYPLADLSKKMSGLDANMTLYWNIVPNVGMLWTQAKGAAPVHFPQYKGK